MDASPYPGVRRSGSARWVCPNDRQLALRAKLRTGWSVKSASLDSRTYNDYTRYSTTSCPGSLSSSTSNTSLPLTEAEKERIIQVIQRAEALDISEQERVGKLVDRLESMKRNVTVVTSTRATNRSCGSKCIRNNRCVCCCSLCGEKFSVLGAGPTLCRDCKKYVCQKCGVETYRSPKSPAGNLQASQRRGTSASVTSLQSNNEAIGSGPGISKQNQPPTKIFLCRICTETREMWKKSGAWFFKSLPKYVLPPKKPRGTARKNTGWTLAGGSRSLEPSEHDSSSDEDIPRRPSRTRSFLSHSLSTDPAATSSKVEIEIEAKVEAEPKCQLDDFHQADAEVIIHQPTAQSQCQLVVPSNSSSSTSPSSPMSLTSPLPPSRSSSRLREHSQSSIFYVKNPIGSSESVNHESSSQCESTKSSVRGRKSSSQGNSVDRAHSRGSIEFGSDGSSVRHSSRRPSINSNGSSETDGVQVFRYDQDRSQQWACRRTESGGTGMAEKTEEEKNYGTLEITLRYEPASQCLHCKVERARGLRPMDIHGLADPFCKLNILPVVPSTTATKRLRTKTVHKTRDPEFNEQLNFYGIMENDLKSGKCLHVLILQDDPAGRDFLGEARFPLRELQPCQTKYYNVSLEDHYQMDQEAKVWGEDMKNGRGVINLTLSYSTRRRALLVTINRAHDLLPMDSNGLSDPFVKLCLTKDPRGDEMTMKRPQVIQNSRESPARRHSKKGPIIPKCTGVTHTTAVKWKTLNPEWSEEFAFETRLTDLTANALVLTVWDKDFGKSNDYLGGLVLSCNSKGARLRHWIDAIKFPDHHHQGTHELTEDIGFHE